MCTINENTFAVIVYAEKVVHSLDHDTGCTHERSGKQQEHGKSIGILQEFVFPFRKEMMEGKVAYNGNRGAEQHGKGNPAKVHETAVSEDAAIGVEYAESDGVGHEQCNKTPEDRPEMARNFCSSAEEVEGKIATEYYNKVVNEQNAPIRQCATSEIPTGETRNEIHNFI